MDVKRQFVLDDATDRKLEELRKTDDRSRSAEVRFLITTEYQRRQVQGRAAERVARQTQIPQR